MKKYVPVSLNLFLCMFFLGCATMRSPDSYLIEKMKNGIVGLSALDSNGHYIGFLGSAFFINDKGYLVTALHVIMNPQTNKIYEKIIIEVPPFVPPHPNSPLEFPSDSTNCKVIAYDDNADITILKAGMLHPQCSPLKLSLVINSFVPFSDSFGISIGDKVGFGGFVVLSNIFGNPRFVYKEGVIASFIPAAERLGEKSRFTTNLIVTDAYPQFGQSGGPLILKNTGEVIGVCIQYDQKMKFKEKPNLPLTIKHEDGKEEKILFPSFAINPSFGFAIPIDAVIKLLRKNNISFNGPDTQKQPIASLPIKFKGKSKFYIY